ncbi:hypothetical protein GNP63_18125 [Aliivibrio fischeri]|uniref:hypothetical protein n=1 Tax=Aliivibrio fischeri TaxID=668 RepID=UPI0012D96FDC|nr:hypothetical protein [Aliivibrio fischeri]MUH98445.1 hypothetical protein [Aliivibrio fischeri]MUI65938.1 hypothetical protein [Aliivibrio fischeri]
MRRYRYRQRRYRGWSNSKPSKVSVLVNLIGHNALNMIIQRFYKSSPEELDLMLRLYGAEHGESAKKYARTSIGKWKSGTVKISGQTQDRLVRLIPACLNTDERYVIAKEICTYHLNQKYKKTVNISINTEEPTNGLNALSTAIQGFYEADDIVELPERLTKAITWLADDDVTIARSILAQVEEEEAKLIESKAYEEVDAIESLLKKDEIDHLNQRIEFPNGYIQISTFTPRKPFIQRILASLFGD